MRRQVGKVILSTSAIALLLLFAPNANAKNQDQDSQTYNQSHQRSNVDQKSAQHMINQYDENEDGVLERSELPRDKRSSFSKLDRDGNGKLTANELKQHAQNMKRRVVPVEMIYIWVSDANRGGLSLNDLQDAYDTLQDIDDNGDGQISRDELQQRRQEITSKWARTLLKRLDDNDDGQVSEDEAQGTSLARQFDQIDQNGNNEISRQELRKYLASDQNRNQGQEQDYRSARRSRDQSRNAPER